MQKNKLKQSVAIIGGGPSALMLAAQLDEVKFDITIYEKNAALGRKFLVAGDGGFNLTHSEVEEQFVSRYTPASFFEPVISSFTNSDFRNWLSCIGIETYTGSSKRVFPVKGIKPIDVLNAILKVLKNMNVVIKTKHVWKGWNDKGLVFQHLYPESTADHTLTEMPDIVVFALGGGSWKVTGSDGSWLNHLEAKGIEVVPFEASNCACEVKWNKEFIELAEGKSLKNIVLKCDGEEKKGEVVLTKFGLEGGALYALSPYLRKQLKENRTAELFLDLKPSLSAKEILNKLSNKGNKSLSKHVADELNINPVQLALLKSVLNKEDFTRLETLSEKIKNLPLIISSLAPIDEAISTVGGVSLNAIDNSFQLKKMPNHYVIGEMLDWDAPTGGYLLQGCFSMGYYLAKFLNNKNIF
ncbi:MAG: NAD(P)-dependent oxidoreductase [Bacteroidota bacterium]